MAFRSLFGLVTLQVATAILATVFFLVGFLVMGINVFSYEKRDIEPDAWPINLTLVWVFVFLMNLTGWFLFLSSYMPSRPLSYVAMLFIAIIVVYWSTLTAISFVNNPADVRRVCVGYRCAESFWIASLKFRSHPFYGGGIFSLLPNEHDIQNPIRPFLTNPINRRKKALQLEQRETTSTKPSDESIVNVSVNSVSEFSPGQNSLRKNKRFANTNLHSVPSIRDEEIKEDSKHNDYNYLRDVERSEMEMKKSYELDDSQYDNPEEDETTIETSPEQDESVYTIMGSAFVGAVVFTLVNFLFFAFSMVTVWGYSQELKLINPRDQRYQTQKQSFEMQTS